eukprot:TRINITY_DN971_c3_g1_i1.p1 TRINITY_DN971_c3_g1~~TRINITY_DN971_c3_g1_i1.p1  ORF type:complete len:746 (+),score=349.04 TRINITY_DN971_c3_g1_i1:172-2409(+)
MSFFGFFNKDDVRSQYKLKQELGRGMSSVVRLGTNKVTGVDVAVKIINKANKEMAADSMLETELSILSRVKHPNVINLEAFFDTKTHLFVVMELANGGELYDVLLQQGSFSERTGSRIIRQILTGVAYLHSQGIVHRDLKPQNILCNKNANGEIENCKITDFGLSKIVTAKPGGKAIMQTACGTPLYVAPELLWGKGYDERVDVWAVSCILYNILSGLYPFYGESNEKIFERILAGRFSFPDPAWTNISESAKDLVRLLFTLDPAKRPTAEQVLSHPWLLPQGDLASSTPIAGWSDQFARSFVKEQTKKAIQNVTDSNENKGSETDAIFTVDSKSTHDLSFDEDFDEERDWASILRNSTVSQFRKEQVLQEEDIPAKNFFLVRKGIVRLEAIKKSGEKIMINTIGIGSHDGVQRIIEPEQRCELRATAEYDVEITVVDITHLNRLFEQDHALAARFYRKLAVAQAQRLDDCKKLPNYKGVKRPSAPKESSDLQFPCKWKKSVEHHGRIVITPQFILATAQIFGIKIKARVPSNKIANVEVIGKGEIRITYRKNLANDRITLTFADKDYEEAHKAINAIVPATQNQSAPTNLNSSIRQSIDDDAAFETQGPLTTTDWEILTNLAEPRRYRKDEVLINAGEPSFRLFHLSTGTCRVSIVRPEDDTVVVLGTIQAREMFGEISFIYNAKATASVIADDDNVEVLIIDGNRLKSHFKTAPDFAARFYKYLVHLLSRRYRKRLATARATD